MKEFFNNMLKYFQHGPPLIEDKPTPPKAGPIYCELTGNKSEADSLLEEAFKLCNGIPSSELVLGLWLSRLQKRIEKLEHPEI